MTHYGYLRSRADASAKIARRAPSWPPSARGRALVIDRLA